MLFSNIILFISVTYSFNEIVANRNDFMKSENITDAPSDKDLYIYLKALTRVISFTSEYRKVLDSNLGFGLFLVNVNIHLFTKDEFSPVLGWVQQSLKSLFYENAMYLDYFNEYSDKKKNNWSSNVSTHFFKDVTTWSRKLNKFDKILPKKNRFKINSYHQGYPNWNTYIHKVYNIDDYHPNPKQSDTCLNSLVDENEEKNSSYSRKCNVPKHCNEMVISGADFGYALTHRLLFLLFSHLCNGCILYSTIEDEGIRERLCDMIYTEAEYIAINGFTHMDLMFEQVALCALEGYGQFLRKSWFMKLLEYQTIEGCFTERHPDLHSDLVLSQSMEDNMSNFMTGACNIHMTAVAAASIAAGIRYILEN